MDAQTGAAMRFIELCARLETRTFRRLLGALALGALSLPAAPAAAQSRGIETVVVTAEKREERLVDVPVSVVALSADSLKKFSLNQATDLGYLVPNVQMAPDSGPRNFSFFIRGIGTTTYASESIESSSAYVVDGVVYGQGGAAVTDLPDLERVEILRGPQGTLFGKNSSAGVVNVVTREPSDTFETYLHASYAVPDNERKVSAYVTGPIGDDAGFLVSARLNRRDGYVLNLFDGRHFDDQNDWGVRGRVVFGKNDRMKLTLIGDYWKSNTRCCIWTFLVPSTPLAFAEQLLVAAGGGFGVDPAHMFSNINGPNYTDVINQGVSAQIDYDLGGGYNLTSISAFRSWHEGDNPDSDSEPLPPAAGHPVFDQDLGDMRQHQFSEEIRVASPKEQFVDFVAGLYYFSQDVHTYNEQFLDFYAVDRIVDVYGATQNYAVFGQGNVNFTDNFRLILGGRLLQERSEAQSFRNFVLPDTSPAEHNAQEKTTSAAVWRVGAQYDLNENANIFATVTRGFKGGGYNTSIDTSNLHDVRPEVPTNYELGLRAALPDTRLSLNLTGFVQNVSNFQVNSLYTPPPPQPQRLEITNAGSAKLKGVETEVSYQPLEDIDWTINGSFAYLDAHFGTYKDAPCYAFQTPAEGCLNGVTWDMSGHRLPFASKFSWNVASFYTHPLGDSGWNVLFNIDANYRSSRDINLPSRPDAAAKPLTLVNASLGIAEEDGRWQVTAFAKNIFNQHFATKSFSSFLLEFDSSPSSQQGFVPYEAQAIFGIMIDVKN